MKSIKDIKLLVIPELFPYYKGDWRGVFILDYLRAVKNMVGTMNVLFVKQNADKKGIFTENHSFFTLQRVYCAKQPARGIKKISGYGCFFTKGTQAAKNIPANLIHVHGSLFTGQLARRIARRKKCPYVVSEHTGPFSRISNNTWYAYLARKTYQSAQAILTVSHYQKQQLVNFGIPAEKIIVTYNPVDTALFKPDEKVEKKKQIVFISRLDAFKGAMKCVSAFARILPENSDWQLVICGEGEEKQSIEQFVADNNLQDNVQLLPMQTREQMAKLFQASAFSVFLSLHETFGLVAAESVACGTPILCSNTTSLPEIISPKEGVPVNPEDEEEITRGMQYLINNYTRFNPLELHQSIEKRFGLQTFGRKLEHIYTKTLQKA